MGEGRRTTDNRRRSGGLWFVVCGLLLFATWLRAPSLFVDGLHPDEALYGTWANWIASSWDMLLREQVVDKPPVLFYVQAVFLKLFSDAEFALKLPNFYASIVIVAVSVRVIGGLSSVVCGLLLVVSPFWIQFSSVGLTDPLMICFVLLGIFFFGRNHPTQAGIFLGLAFATKYTAIFWFPLLLSFGRWTTDNGQRWSVVRRLSSGLFPVLALTVLWLVMSGNGLSGTGDGQLIAGIRPITIAEFIPRLQIWNEHLRAVFGVPFWWVFLPACVWLGWFGRTQDRLLIAYALLFFAFHWLIATATHDRYMLPLAWMGCVVVGKSLNHRGHRVHRGKKEERRKIVGVGQNSLWLSVFSVVVFLLFLPSALKGQSCGFAVGCGSAEIRHLAPLAQPLSDEPYGTVLYDHFHSWQLRHALFDERVYVEWVPNGESLVENLAVFYDEGRYLALPDSAESQPFHVALTDHGYTLQTLVKSDGVILYKINR